MVTALLQASCSWPTYISQEATSTPEVLFNPTVTDQTTPTPTVTPEISPAGKIVFTCQLTGIRYQDQICLINADGSGFRRLTTDDFTAHFYPSLAPDGNSVVYSANPTGVYEIYEINLQGNSRQVTSNLGTLTAPEISPDGSQIAFSHGDGETVSIWVINRDGTQPQMVFSPGWDPTWSPDGEKLLFASYDENNSIQLFIVNLDGSGLTQLTQLPNLRGRSDWSPDGSWAVTYYGEPWGREVYVIPINGVLPYQITPSGGNSQGPSISPDGQWLAFTAYYDEIGNDDGCEIYVIRIDGSRLTRLTENDYCDWQPRWGP